MWRQTKIQLPGRFDLTARHSIVIAKHVRLSNAYENMSLSCKDGHENRLYISLSRLEKRMKLLGRVKLYCCEMQ